MNDFEDVEQWHFQMGDLVRRLERLDYDDLRFLANRVSSGDPRIDVKEMLIIGGCVSCTSPSRSLEW